MKKGAVISPCGAYRYRLWREWDESLKRACFCMLNPSTADADHDDPTIRRCIGFAKAWGLGGIEVVNLYAYRSTDPAVLFTMDARDAIGPENDDAIVASASESLVVVAAWGANARWKRPLIVYGHLLAPNGPVVCLGVTKNGEPRHPLYVRANTRPTVYSRVGVRIDAGSGVGG